MLVQLMWNKIITSLLHFIKHPFNRNLLMPREKNYQFHYSWDPNIVWEVEILFINLLVFLLLCLLVDVVFPSCDSFLFLIFYFHLFFMIILFFLFLLKKKDHFFLPPPFFQLSFLFPFSCPFPYIFLPCSSL